MKLFVFLAALGALLLADDAGYALYQKHCAQCHIESITKAETLKRFKELKAPPMVEVSNRLKENVIIKDDDDDVKRRVIIAFIKDYIQNPSIDYSMCHPMAIERFDIMPSLKGKLTPDEIDTVAAWVYDRYEGENFQ
jgi:hypothetical protein